MTDDQATEAAQAARAALCAGLAEDLDQGFAELVRAYERVVYSVALRVSGRPAEAEDLAAEAFLRAYRALRGYRRDRIMALQPRSWLLTILLNTWRNTVRTASRRPSQVPLDELAEPAQPGPGVEDLAESMESRRELGALVAQLPEAQRIAVVLRHVEGLPTSEVAAVLRCPEGTAKSHISRGLRRLRTLYAAGEPLCTGREQR
ncbi:RNA polymerase sigma factor [Amycolatopsis nigrescens]|uniref:RNA polymerase sigma factor n=1 Tax=Amycolatopsis nigrescens TaxID=381445 RepID=UPI000373BD5C|nr:RNA polymerase sigma factor [Amycolatopsis nigrescens]